MAQTVTYKTRRKKNVKIKAATETQETAVTGFLEGVTQNELDTDARLWTEKFNAATPEQLARLEKLFDEDIAEGTFLLDSSDR